MRLVEVDSKCSFSASSIWRLRETDDFDRFNGLKDKREVSVDREERFDDADGKHKMRKVVSSRLLDNPVPLAMRALVDAKQIAPIMTLEWFLDHYDSEHPCTYSVSTPAFERSVKVEGKQWMVESGMYASLMHALSLLVPHSTNPSRSLHL